MIAGHKPEMSAVGSGRARSRLNMILYNLLSTSTRVGLPAELHSVRPTRLRFLLLDAVGKTGPPRPQHPPALPKAVPRALAGPQLASPPNALS